MDLQAMLKPKESPPFHLYINIFSDKDQKAKITIAPSSDADQFYELDEEDALKNGESRYQIQEGRSYEYLIDKAYQLEEIPGIISRSKLNKNSGRITPNIYVGTLSVSIIDCDTLEKCGEFKLEVQSLKASYREDYRFMLEEIAEKCTDLLMQHSSPVTQSFTIDLEQDSRTAYQRFAFIKSIIDSEEFESAVHKVLIAPTTRWASTIIEKNIQAVKKFDRKVAHQLATSKNRIKYPFTDKIDTIPEKVSVVNKKETVDTPENRFIKFALESFLSLCSEFSHLKDQSRVKKEALDLEEKLEQYLNHSIFKDISSPTSLPLNSPVLQRKEGYREIFRTWLLFDLAAKLVWSGGEDVYSGGKKDVAVLYEYWLFFKFIEVVAEVFNIQHPAPESLIDETLDGFGLKLKQGRHIAIKDICTLYSRRLNIQFSYNRTYSGDQPYPKPGSWSKNMRPDYTLTIWPYGINEDQAEHEELIVHIHFDAKYKIDKFQDVFNNDIPLSDEKEEQRKGTYKRVDLLKMHAYKDAIRRTFGAYIIYPGQDETHIRKGFHEIIPGLGVFSIRPSKTDNGIEELKSFLYDITKHFNNRASQRERMSYKTYENYKDPNPNLVNQSLPETIGEKRGLIPDETFVLVAFYKGEDHLKWIEKEKLYNARIGSGRGSLHLSPKETGAKYLLLHSSGETKTSKLYKLLEHGPRLFSKDNLIKKHYPFEPSQQFYLVYDIREETEKEFDKFIWDITRLPAFKSYRESSYPFSTTLTELMKVATIEHLI
jgi:predicted component of viral defense system (DUF524 family)